MREKMEICLKDPVNCNMLRTTNFSREGLPCHSLFRTEFVNLLLDKFLSRAVFEVLLLICSSRM